MSSTPHLNQYHSASSGSALSGLSSHNSTGTGSGSGSGSSGGLASSTNISGVATGSAGDGITPEMRDRQARGKNPYSIAEESEESGYDEEMDDDDDDDHDEVERGRDGRRRRRVRLGRGPKPEPFEDRERRGFALSVLDNPEQLMMYAQSTGDSIPGQRLRFTAMLCGFDSSRERGRNTPSRSNRRVSDRMGR